MSCRLICVSVPRIPECNTAEELIAYCARVSNPTNQANLDTAPKLIKYLIKNNHLSPFEMVNLTIEIKTTRDIGRQILRHRSFSFQEFSQRYAEVDKAQYITSREARLQDKKNRQNSVEVNDGGVLQEQFNNIQQLVYETAMEAYATCLQEGIAKEQARCLLPEGLTMSTMYMAGSLRSWIHYCALRSGNGTQKEHKDIALECWNIIGTEFPDIINAFKE